MLAAARDGKGPALVEVSPPAFPKVDEVALKVAAARCDRALIEAETGVYPAPASTLQGVFAEQTWSLVDQGRELAGERVVSPEEI
jgi:hypothetical protein